MPFLCIGSALLLFFGLQVADFSTKRAFLVVNEEFWVAFISLHLKFYSNSLYLS